MKSRILSIVSVIALIAISSSAASRAMAQGSDDIDELEFIEEVQDVESTESSSFLDFLGDQHPAVIHFPIAWLTLLLLLELGNLRLRSANLHTVGRYLLVLGVLSFVPALVTGLIKADLESFTAEYDAIMDWHRNLNILTFGLTLIALFVRPRDYVERLSGRVLTYRLLVLAAAALILFSGHLGGRLVHG